MVNVFPIGAITKGSAGEELAAIGAMKAAGAVAISDDGLPVMNARVMRRAMEFARSYDLPVIEHCEDLNLSAGGDMHEGARSVRWGLRGIPAASEDVMVARDLLLAELTGARYHVAHISTRNAVAMVDYARAARPAGDLRSHAAPFRAGRRRHAALRQQLQDEAAAALRRATATRWWRASLPARSSAIATDHAPHPGSEKMQEFERCPFGIIGLETALGLALEQLVHPGQDLAGAHGGAVHHRPGIGVAPGPRHAGARRARRRHHFQHRARAGPTT